MEDTPPQEWHWIADDEAVAAILPELERASALAVDTESDNFHAYAPSICLLQLATPYDHYLLDTLEISTEGIQLLAPVLSDPTQPTVIHGADNDLSHLWNQYGIRVGGLFDTILAARFLNKPKRGLGDLLFEYFGVKTSKRFQKFDWRTRPLPDDALAYAVLDVRHTLPLYEMLQNELAELDRLNAVFDESQELAEREFQIKDFDPFGYLRIKGAKGLSLQEQGVLYALYQWRHEVCMETNQAGLFVAENKVLMSLARAQPRSLKALRDVPSVSGYQVRTYGRDWLDAIREGQKKPPPQKPRKPRSRKPRVSQREQEQQAQRLERLRTWRAEVAEREAFEIDLVATNATLLALSHHPPDTLDELEHIPGMLPWRCERFGREILKVL